MSFSGFVLRRLFSVCVRERVFVWNILSSAAEFSEKSPEFLGFCIIRNQETMSLYITDNVDIVMQIPSFTFSTTLLKDRTFRSAT